MLHRYSKVQDHGQALAEEEPVHQRAALPQGECRGASRRACQMSTMPQPQFARPSLALLGAEPFRAALEFVSHQLGRAAPRSAGDGHPVVLFPGLAADSTSPAPLPLREHCRALGYAASTGGVASIPGRTANSIAGWLNWRTGLQEPGSRRAGLPLDQVGGPARSSGLPLHRAARTRARLPVHAGLLRRVGSSRQRCQSWAVKVSPPSIARFWTDSMSAAW